MIVFTLMQKVWSSFVLSCLVFLGSSPANDLPAPGTPPLPSDLPIAPPTQPRVNTPAPLAPAPTIRPRLPNPAQIRTVQPIRTQPAGPRVVNPADSPLTWDEMNKEYTAQPGELTADFSFAVTNTSKADVVINWVRPSCGCTVAKLPPTPWKLAPGEGGTIDLGVDLRGKYGTLSKYVSVDTSHGQIMLTIRVNIPAQQTARNNVLDTRTRNMQIAMADRQAVFKGSCAACHVNPAIGRKGEQLYSAACAICHDAPHRATMVPDLKALKFTPTKEYWAHWIKNGKPGSLMPAFAKAQGGPLSDEQIESLAEYLAHDYLPRDVAAAGTKATAPAAIQK